MDQHQVPRPTTPEDREGWKSAREYEQNDQQREGDARWWRNHFAWLNQRLQVRSGRTPSSKKVSPSLNGYALQTAPQAVSGSYRCWSFCLYSRACIKHVVDFALPFA